ncbi:Mbeg1-like protein [uncultured Streptococcus sp.]|uniref:Mbeg1-like protein n=1 Tax=uncultured Streptococcus sp. TaxID=83427 RepID=UPI0026DC7127|nr:Mbeg1-like protein [uncultured Streptococcus sp.]
MATINGYLDYNKNRSFKDFAFNEADILCLNELGYFCFEELDASIDFSKEVNLHEFLMPYVTGEKPFNHSFLVTEERVKLLQKVVASKRFVNLNLSDYVNDVDAEYERQFSAMVFTLPEINHHQLVFRGTDDTMIGWKEDFKLTYVQEIPAHRAAVAYLEAYFEKYAGKVTVSGHSKGGNLALYAVAHVNDLLREQIEKVYMLDAPGLQEKGLESDGYKAIRERVTVIRPEESIVGIMLYNDIDPIVVKSNASGIMQHAVTSWQFNEETGELILAERQTDLSQNLEKTFKQWMKELSSQELKILFDILFDTLMSSGIHSINDVTIDREFGAKLATSIASFYSIGTEKKLLLAKSAKLFLQAFVGHSRLGNFSRDKINLSLPDFNSLLSRLDKKK